MSVLTLGVIADTHVPDRARRVPLWALDVFRQAGVRAILHAGDLSHPRVLDTLAAIAPVIAVRGNRDIWLLRDLPKARLLTFGSVSVYLTHGHGSPGRYLRDKVYHLVAGNPYRRLEQRMAALDVPAEVVVFGHTHHAVNRRVGGRLLFNPGSTCRPLQRGQPPSVGLLWIAGETVRGEIIPRPG